MATPIASHNGMLRRFPDSTSVIYFTSSLQWSDIYSLSQYAPQPHLLASLVGSMGTTLIGHGMCKSILDVPSWMMDGVHHFSSALQSALKMHIIHGIRH